MPLSPKQQRFVQEYLIDLCATKAAIRAGYSERTANEQGSRLLAKVNVQDAIQAAQHARGEKAEMDAAWVLAGLKENFERAMQRKPVLDREGNETGQWQWNGAVANKALEMVGRHLAMWKDRIEHTIRHPVEIKVIEIVKHEPHVNGIALPLRSE